MTTYKIHHWFIARIGNLVVFKRDRQQALDAVTALWAKANGDRVVGLADHRRGRGA